MIPYFRETFGNPHSSAHALGWAASAAVERAAESVGRLIGADADEIIFTSGATESNNLALQGIALGDPERRRILVSRADHKSVLEAAKGLEGRGFEIAFLPIDANGVVDIERCAPFLNERVLLISVSLVNSEIGTIQNMEGLSALARECGAYLHLDGAQAPGAIDMSSASGSADLISLSGHKIYGPKGIGALYVARHVQDSLRPMILGGGQQYNLRSGTVPVPLCAGFAKAAEIMMVEGLAERLRLASLRDGLLMKLRHLPWEIVLNGPEARHPGNLNVEFRGFDAESILSALQPGVAASTGSACISGEPEPSYVLRAIGLSHEAASSSIRFGVGRETTEQDIADAVSLIERALQKIDLEAA